LSSRLTATLDSLEILPDSYVHHAWLQATSALAILIAIAWLANWVAKRVVLKLLGRLLGRLPFPAEVGHFNAIVARLANIVPALIIRQGISAVPHLPGWTVGLVESICAMVIILTIAMAISGGLNLVNVLYQRRPDARNKPIKGYVEVAKLVIYAAAVILMIATLMDRSPLLLLSGLGAMAAVLMLVFKDTILGLVASVQIGSNDMVRIGDWIEMPQFNADGDVIDIALHTVKVQNWDKTVTTIPTYRLIEQSFRNYRSMFESGGRRIMRSLVIDQNSVQFLDDDQLASLSRFSLLREYLESKQADVSQWNSSHAASDVVDCRRLTNIGTFRAYVTAYLRARPDVSDDMLMIVRQLAPSELGLPLQIYAFTKTTAWVQYEGIQADIFDHLIAILPEFGLRLFQRPTGYDAGLNGKYSAISVID